MQKAHHFEKKEMLCVLQSDLEVQLERMINEKKECEQTLDRSVEINNKYCFA